MQPDFKKIQSIMAAKTLSIADMAKAAGMSYTAMVALIGKARRGVKILERSTGKIANGLGVNADDILMDEE